MRKVENTKKLILKKFQIAKISNPNFIVGGSASPIDECQGGDSGGMGTQRIVE
jgi:hypothetical protein